MIDPREPEWVEIPAGHFTMGDLWGDGDPDERPTFPVSVERFWLGKYTVTNSQFLRFLEDIHDPLGRDGHVFVDVRSKNNPVFRKDGAFACREGYENYPAIYVSWVGAFAYCEWLGEKSGRSVRLPSEAEWQYAAMGPHGFKWGRGDTFRAEEYVCAQDGPAPADYGEPTEWGLFNITGNIFEWCADEYGFALGNRAEENVLRRSRVIKGGAFILRDSANFRNAKRFSCHQQSCLSSIGFRVAATTV